MTKYLVDIPTCPADDEGWVNVEEFDTKQEAIAFIKEHIGVCDDDGNVCLISKIEDDYDEN